MLIIIPAPHVSFWYRSVFKKIYVCANKSTFQRENQNSEHTFVSSTLKVEETKVPSELDFPIKNMIFGHVNCMAKYTFYCKNGQH